MDRYIAGRAGARPLRGGADERGRVPYGVVRMNGGASPTGREFRGYL